MSGVSFVAAILFQEPLAFIYTNLFMRTLHSLSLAADVAHPSPACGMATALAHGPWPCAASVMISNEVSTTSACSGRGQSSTFGV